MDHWLEDQIWDARLEINLSTLLFKTSRQKSTDFMFSLEDSENMQECRMSQNLRHEVKPVEKHYGMTVGHELQCSHITFINHRVTVLYYISRLYNHKLNINGHIVTVLF